MATVGELLIRAKIYRSSFTDAQIVDWMDTTQRQIYQDVPHEALPYNFITIDGNPLYSLPSDCDPLGIKKITIETKVGSGVYKQLPFLSIESTERVSVQSEFYSISSNQDIYLNPQPIDTTEGKNVSVVYNKRPARLDSTILTAVPDLDVDFHELLELGAKIRIARERGEVVDKNNFQTDYDRLFMKYQDRYKVVYPEYPIIKDTMPRKRRGYHSRYAREARL